MSIPPDDDDAHASTMRPDDDHAHRAEPDDGDDAHAATVPATEGENPLGPPTPEEDAGVRALARARFFGAMFGGEAGSFGRFRVLERLGAGAMGVVYAAYDPQLDRGVALKLIRVAEASRDGALAEAKALARLSHPNVVPIYDVGAEGAHVYLVMELVRGKTLRAWVVDRTAREILDVYQQAGAALAAAHAAGLVHRDFKPDNALVGSDGRVRVVDFGLACEAEETRDAPRAAAGTPHYMAPEIAAGSAVTPAADQYSFSVALRDALAKATSPAPRRVAAILERGRAAEPGARFPTMPQLLRALARADARRGRKIAVGVALALAVGATAFVAGRGATTEACAAAGDRLAWHPLPREAAVARVATLGAYGDRLAPQLATGLAAYAVRWTTADHAACVDRVAGAQSDVLAYRRELCLQRGRDAFTKLGELVAVVTPQDLVALARGAQSLPDPALCSDADALTSDVAPPPPALAPAIDQVHTQLARARIDFDAGHYEHARDAARAAVGVARTLAYQPVLAEALLLEGRAQEHVQRRDASFDEALSRLDEAYSVAMLAHEDALAIEAFARRAWLRATSPLRERATDGVDAIEPFAERTTGAGFARALLYNNLGSIELALDHRDRARTAFQRAQRAAAGFAGHGALELVVIQANLGLVTDDHREGDRLILAAANELSARLGADHPDTLAVRLQRGLVTLDDLHQVVSALAPICESYELHPDLALTAIACWQELGMTHLDLGERPQALAAFEHAKRRESSTIESSAYAAWLTNDSRRATAVFEAALAERAAQPGEAWWYQLRRGGLYLGLGHVRLASGELRPARAALERAIDELQTVVASHPASSHARRLGRARVELARVLAALHAPASELIPVATEAARWLRAVGGTTDEQRELEALVR